jgi:crossover junction endodeoxyribonuclease RuvC
MIIAGVDNGFTGAITLMDVDRRRIIESLEMPIVKNKKNEINEKAVKEILFQSVHIFIEKAQVMPKQGISSSGRYMMAYGIVRGICVGLGIPYTLVTPQRWKNVMMADMPKEKGASIIAALRMFPELSLPRKKDHGRADSILIAAYGARLLTGK